MTCDMSVFFPDPPVSSTNKTDRQDITDILLKVALNTIKQIEQKQYNKHLFQQYISAIRALVGSKQTLSNLYLLLSV